MGFFINDDNCIYVKVIFLNYKKFLVDICLF